MDLTMIILSLLAHVPASPEAPSERTLHALAAYVRTVALKKGWNARLVAAAIGIKPAGYRDYRGAETRFIGLKGSSSRNTWVLSSSITGPPAASSSAVRVTLRRASPALMALAKIS
jgi:hypothetical protein